MFYLVFTPPCLEKPSGDNHPESTGKIFETLQGLYLWTAKEKSHTGYFTFPLIASSLRLSLKTGRQKRTVFL